jgi:hypothetical protein
MSSGIADNYQLCHCFVRVNIVISERNCRSLKFKSVQVKGDNYFIGKNPLNLVIYESVNLFMFKMTTLSLLTVKAGQS